MKRNTAISLLYIVTLALPCGALWLATPAKKVAAAPVCKVQMVEVTKTEGDLTWTEHEEMCL